MATRKQREGASSLEVSDTNPMAPSAAEEAAAVRAEETGNGTRLDSHIDAPSVTQAGDGPADTLDPTERASSIEPNKAAAAMAGHLTVNAVVPVDREKFAAGVAISSAMAADGEQGDARIEEYDLAAPDGTVKHVRRNLDTGEYEVS